MLDELERGGGGIEIGEQPVGISSCGTVTAAAIQRINFSWPSEAQQDQNHPTSGMKVM